MSKHDRSFDAEEAVAGRISLADEIDRVERIALAFVEGSLQKAPAFGYVDGAVSSARVRYGQMHSDEWKRLHGALEKLYEARDVMDRALEGYEDAELESVRELEQQNEESRSGMHRALLSEATPDMDESPGSPGVGTGDAKP